MTDRKKETVNRLQSVNGLESPLIPYARIKLYDNGAEMQTKTVPVPRYDVSQHKRKAIKGWSAKSRKRMRRFLLHHETPEGHILCGCTWTLPSRIIFKPDFFKPIFQRWTDLANKNKWCVVWRIEVQKRGQVHWHCLVSVPEKSVRWSECIGDYDSQINVSGHTDSLLETQMGDILLPENHDSLIFAVRRKIKQSWLNALSNCPEFELRDYPWFKENSPFIVNGKCDNLLKFPGAVKYSADVQWNNDNEGSWLRYMSDHTTKSKQEQLPEYVGRHWGVIGKVRFKKRDYMEGIEFETERLYRRFLKQWHRLVTPRKVCTYWKGKGKKRRVYSCDKFGKNCTGKLFGGCKSWVSKRGVYGNTVVFTKPETIKRLALWALETYA